MAKKVTEVQNGDVRSNVIVLRSVFGKVGQKYYIQPQRDSKGRYADCVKRVDANGDIILTPEELQMDHIDAWSKGGRTVLSNAQVLCAPCNRKKSNF